MIDKIKYDLTKLAPSSIYRQLPLGRTHADIVASKLSAGKGGVVPERVAGEDAAAAPDINVAHCHGDPERPAAEFSPGKDPALDLRDGLVSPVAYYIRDINGNWQRGVEAFMQIGRLCAEANTHLTTAQKRQLIEALPFGDTAFSKFVRIGTDTRLQTPHIQRLLPVHYTTTYAVTLLTDEELKQAIADNVLHPDMTRAQLQRWRNSHRENPEVAPSHKDAVGDPAVVGLPIGSTRDVDSGALPCMTDDSQENKEELASAPDNAPAREPVAPVAGPLAPSDDIPPFLDRRPLSPEDQRAYDAIKATLNSHVLPSWNRASAVVRERIIAEVLRANPS
jgi:hypothetical protein